MYFDGNAYSMIVSEAIFCEQAKLICAVLLYLKQVTALHKAKINIPSRGYIKN